MSFTIFIVAPIVVRRQVVVRSILVVIVKGSCFEHLIRLGVGLEWLVIGCSHLNQLFQSVGAGDSVTRGVGPALRLYTTLTCLDPPRTAAIATNLKTTIVLTAISIYLHRSSSISLRNSASPALFHPIVCTTNYDWLIATPKAYALAAPVTLAAPIVPPAAKPLTQWL